MKTSPATEADLRRSVVTVRPLANAVTGTPSAKENARPLTYLRGGGITTFLCGASKPRPVAEILKISRRFP